MIDGSIWNVLEIESRLSRDSRCDCKNEVGDMTMQKKNILNNFKDVLGQYCAINQFIELSKRCFVLDHGKDMATRESFIALATRNSVTLTDYNAENMVNAISRSYIVNVNL